MLKVSDGEMGEWLAWMGKYTLGFGMPIAAWLRMLEDLASQSLACHPHPCGAVEQAFPSHHYRQPQIYIFSESQVWDVGASFLSTEKRIAEQFMNN